MCNIVTKRGMHSRVHARGIVSENHDRAGTRARARASSVVISGTVPIFTCHETHAMTHTG